MPAVDSNSKTPGGLPTVRAAYIRVSSRSQDYAYQRHAIEKACKSRNVLIHRWFADVASGRNMQRPQLRALREQIRKGVVGEVWVWRLDRLTRSGIVDTLSAITEMRRFGCECVSVADGFALEGPAAELVLAVLAWAAQMEREKIRENQLAARARMRSEGRPWGRPPLPPDLRDQARELRSIERLSEREIARRLKKSKTWVHSVLGDFER